MSVTLLTVRNILTATTRFLFVPALLGGIAVGHAAETEMLDTIRLRAQEHALAQIDTSNFQDASATAGTLDTRLQLKKCDIPLETFSTGAMNSTSRMTVGVRCNGLKPWTLYVPVTLSAWVDVVFSSRALSRGELLTQGDMEIRRVPLNKLPNGFLSDNSQLADFELTRPVKAGTALTLNTVRRREIVQQGQEVIIVAQTSGFQVRMSGEALKNGQLGDKIPVRNLNSGRTIEATVLSNSTVSVNL